MWRYIGEGAFIPGVPTRDISDEEAQDLGIVQLLQSSGIYRHAKDEAAKPTPAAAEKKGD